ncbi:MAG: hypothetical protein PHT31_01600 [Candidatus Omnitrophica bacterium]|nr:hypothetical protein [Candidatus Omnitrophota bacterium]MDD5652843.1 hypothetical protein [Candidatus Omnitrophota bacterium]
MENQEFANFLAANHRAILDKAKLFEKIFDAIGHKDFWGLTEFILLYGMILYFKPKYILELGRAFGNSLYTISIAADSLGYQPELIESVCLADTIFESKKKVEAQAGYNLNPAIKITTRNFLKYDGSAFLNADDILILYDIHGKKLIRHFLGRYAPILKQKRHLAIFHDFSYFPGMTKKDFLLVKKNDPLNYKDHCCVQWEGPPPAGIVGYDEVPELLNYVRKRRLTLNFPYLSLSGCLDACYLRELEGFVNYRKGFSTSLISVTF